MSIFTRLIALVALVASAISGAYAQVGAPPTGYQVRERDSITTFQVEVKSESAYLALGDAFSAEERPLFTQMDVIRLLAAQKTYEDRWPRKGTTKTVHMAVVPVELLKLTHTFEERFVGDNTDALAFEHARSNGHFYEGYLGRILQGSRTCPSVVGLELAMAAREVKALQERGVLMMQPLDPQQRDGFWPSGAPKTQGSMYTSHYTRGEWELRHVFRGDTDEGDSRQIKTMVVCLVGDVASSVK